MRELLEKINIREIVLLISVGAACLFLGQNQGLRKQDANVILELRQNNQRLVQLVNFAIKQDTTGAVNDAAKKILD